MESTQYEDIVARWKHHECVMKKAKQADETKPIREELKALKDMITEAMLQQQLEHKQTSHGWVSLIKKRCNMYGTKHQHV